MRPLQRIVDSPAFTGAVVTVILANALVLGLQTYPGLEREHGGTLDLLNALFLAFFVVEISLRIASYLPRPWRFFLDGWNIFDFLAVSLAFAPGLRENSTVLRLARLARIVRVVHLLPDVRILRRLRSMAEGRHGRDANRLAPNRVRSSPAGAAGKRPGRWWAAPARRLVAHVDLGRWC